jgi:hypothetical protein
MITLAAVGAAQSGTTTTAAQTGQAAFSASAVADLGRGDVRVVPPIVVESLADPGAVTAQASLDSLSTSRAFAANPFPGTLVGQLPGTLSGAVGTPSLPNVVPTVVTAEHPLTPTDSFSAGPAQMQAESNATTASAWVTDGSNRSSAKVLNDPTTGEVIARAESIVGGIELGNVMSISGYRSVAEMRRTPSGEIETYTDISVARLTILDQSFSIGPDGVDVLGSAVPLPGAEALLDQLMDAAAGEGYSVELVEPVVTEESAVAPGLVVTYTTDVPNVGSTTTTVTFGRSLATLSSRPVGRLPAGVLPVPSNVGSIPSVGGGMPASPGSLGMPSVAIPAPAASGGTPAPSERPATTLTMVDITDTTPLGRFYPVLFAAGCCLFLFATAYHHLGEKLQWIS